MSATSRKRSAQRGVALIMVLASLTLLTVMLAQFQEETSVEFASALSDRDALKAEYAARSAINLSRLLIAAEPTIRKKVSFIPNMPQIPVWAFASQVLGAFNDSEGAEAFQSLASVDIAEGKNLGLHDASFHVQIVDEDSKINVNGPSRDDVASKILLAAELLGLISGPQYDEYFDGIDSDGQHTDRRDVCSAFVDWVDSDQDQFTCEPGTAQFSAAAAEDSHYQMLKDPYPRKNAAFDSIEELRMVRGVNDAFWSTFVEPDPDDLVSRTLTVWGSGKINVNTANAQTLLAVVCGGGTGPVCDGGEQTGLFMGALAMMKAVMPGIPVFASERAFVRTMEGKGTFAIIFEQLGVQPIKFNSKSQAEKAITVKSQVFSIVADGVVKSGGRETHTKIHAVVDFNGAPPLIQRPPPGPQSNAATAQLDAVIDLLQTKSILENPGGRIVYYRVN